MVSFHTWRRSGFSRTFAALAIAIHRYERGSHQDTKPQNLSTTHPTAIDVPPETRNPMSPGIITDSYLQSVLETCTGTREQCMKLIDQVEASAIADGQDAPLETQQELSKQQKVLYSYLSQLRGLNRNAIIKVRNTKQSTSEARQEVDRLHLQLQNLYYEERHLQGEIAACESYEYGSVIHALRKSLWLTRPQPQVPTTSSDPR